MNIIETELKGLLIVEPQVFEDERGYFFESFNAQKWKNLVGEVPAFVQDNESMSQKGVLRGLHFQKPPFAQGKLVRVTQGSVLDVAVDLRKDSPTYGKHHKVVLSADNKRLFYIPEGFAHGFVALEDNTQFNYKCTNYYNKESEGCINWKDETLSIDWGVEKPIISEKDQLCQDFVNFASPF